MAQVTMVSKQEHERLVRRVEQLERVTRSLVKKTKKAKTKRGKPAYGSAAWWEQAEKAADEDIKAGRVAVLRSVDDLDKPIKELFP